MRHRAMAWVGRAGLVAAVAVLAGCEPKSPPAASHLAEFNRGCALLEQYRYSEAAAAFESVLAAMPAWRAARFNLGVALLNMAEDEGAQRNLDRAREAFKQVLAEAPDHLPARYCLGLYHQHLGELEAAGECFRKVHEGDASDPHAAYKYGEALAALGRNDEAAVVFQKAVALDPGFISAVYRLAQQYNRSGRREEAKALFERFRALNAVELAAGVFTVGKPYGAAGKYYLALGADNLPLARPRVRGTRIVFSPEVSVLPVRPRAWNWGGGLVAMAGLAAGDVDGDGDLDLCVTGCAPDDATVILFNDGHGVFTRGASIEGRGAAPCFGDVNNNGHLDLWLGGADGDRLFLNDGKGSFTAAPGFEAASETGALTRMARLLDMDSDGDLDLVAVRVARGGIPARPGDEGARAALLSNHLDGTFRDVSRDLGVAPPEAAESAVVYDDFDNDRDLDLVFFHADGRPPVGWVNDRLLVYRTRAAEALNLSVTSVVSATSGDPDNDGHRDLLVFTGDAVHLLLNDGTFRFEADARFAATGGRTGGTGGQFADVDNDGDLDVVIGDARRSDGTRGPAVLLNLGPEGGWVDAATQDPGLVLAALETGGDASCVAADFTGNGCVDILCVPTEREPFLVRNVTPGTNWIALDLLGTRPGDQTSRSNGSAIGARVEVKAGAVFQQFVVGVPSGPVAMPPLRVHAGLGPTPMVEWLRIIWPDGVLQAELELPGNRVTQIVELQRKVSSCPLLFAWTGEHFEFVADFGGVGGVGYLVAPGVYGQPDPTEYVSIPRLAARDGEYVLQVLCALEEVVYMDEAALLAVDHPEDTQVYPHEMMAVSVPPPPFELFCIRDVIEPVAARDHRGVDVTDALRSVDRIYAGTTALDGRFVGVAEPHHVELDLGDRLSKVPEGSRLILFLEGWVEYGYSSTNYAASQAGVALRAPTIEVLRDGAWQAVFREVGYPAGINHMMTLDVTGAITPRDRHVRIGSNMALHWDRIFFGVHRQDVALTVKEVHPGGAELQFRGFPREYSPDGRKPNLFDYKNMDRAVAWRLMEGAYTRFGDVTELLAAADDMYVIMGRGEELTLRFPEAAFGPVPAGMRRSFILKTDSYCKDMDLYTAFPDTVEPLPFHAMSGYPYGDDEHYPDSEAHREYQRRYNTRMIRVRPDGLAHGAARE